MSESKKLIPRRRFKQFNGDWNITTLGKIAEIVRGASPRPIQDQKWFDKNSDIGWLRISDVTEQEGRIYYLEQRLSVAGQEKTRVLYEPHLLLSIAATVGKPVINYIKTGVHDGFLIFLNPKFHREFLFQYLDMFKLQWQKYGQPGSQVNLNSDIVKNHNIELPNSDEQTQIGEFFKKLDNLINTQQKKLEKAKTLKSAYLTEMFPNEGELKPRLRFKRFSENWGLVKLSGIVKITMGQSPDGMNYTLDSNNHILVQGNADIQNGKVIPRLWTTQVTKTANAGDIIYTVRAPVGDLARTDYRVVLGRGVAGINGNDFIYQLLNKMKQDGFWNKYSSGSTFDSINYLDLAEALVKHPNLSEQTKIGNFFKLLDNKIALEQKKLDKLKHIKQAYLNEMFV
jgi:type I restriction enzyme, S subunit